MKAEKIDRRIKYTKLMLKNSLLELMKEHSISKVSVKMLCESADINRSTFYSHYTDQFDLLHQLEREVIEELREQISKHIFTEQTTFTVQAMNQLLEYTAKNADLFKVLLSENGDSSFQKDIMLIAQEKTILELRNNNSLNIKTSEYMQCFVITGSLSILQKWLQDDLAESTQEMAELITNLLYQGLSGIYDCSRNGL